MYIIGVGPGNPRCLTVRARELLQSCDAVIGAKAVVDSLAANKPVFYEYLPDKVREVLDAHPSIRCAAVVMRGDHSVKSNHKVFVLTGGDNTVDIICRRLCEYGYGGLPVTVGERLSYPEEKITHGTAAGLIGQTFDSLSILFIENDCAIRQIYRGIPDEDFIRGDVPMTKSEVRAISLSKLGLSADSIVFDVGAGTGSVSIECALTAYDGQVYAIEKEADAASLIKANKRRFGCENLHIIEGFAPDALVGLPAALLRMNPDVRIVVNAVTLETQAETLECIKKFGFARSETVAVNIARSRRLGRYNMMTAQNPVYVITMEGGAAVD